MWAWKMQTMCEAHVLKIYDVHFYVCWLGRVPDPKHYHFKYNKKECSNAWDIITKHRDLMVARESIEA